MRRWPLYAATGLLCVLAAPLRAELEAPKSSVMFSLKTSYTAISWGDFAMTTTALARYRDRISEANPIARAYIEKPGLAVACMLLSDIAVHLYGDWLYKKNKTAAYVVLGALVLVRAYVMYQNARTSQRFAR